MINRDPLKHLIDYVNTVKPYHTKVYEVLLQYEYTEPIHASVKESYQIYTTMTTPEANKWFMCDGVGWDNNSYGIGLWDYPYDCDAINPNKIVATIKDDLHLFVDVLPPAELAFTYARDHTGPLGWDVTKWDHTEWDPAYSENWVQVQEVASSGADEPVGTSITESLTIQVT